MPRANQTMPVRRTLSELTIVAALLLVYSGCVWTSAQPAPKVDDGGQKALRREPATQPIYSGVIADADRTMDFYYAIMQETPEADISVITQVAPPQLQARGPVIVYIEGRAGRVDAEHINTYVTGRGGGGDMDTRFGIIRDSVTGYYRVYHFPRTTSDADSVTVTINGAGSQVLAAGQYIDVVRDTMGVWWFSNHLGTGTPLAWPANRAADIDRIKDVAEKAKLTAVGI